MNCCFDTIIDCCDTLTDTATKFIDAMEETSGMTYGGLMKNKRCIRIIKQRREKGLS